MNTKLIRNLKKGKLSAYKELFDEWYPKMVHYAYSLIRDPQSAEDIVQQVFIKVWEKRKSLVEDGEIGSFLYVLTKRSCLNWIRDHKQSEDLDESTRSAETDPLDILIEKERESIINRTIDSLPKQRRKAFIFNAVEQLSDNDIADLMHLSVRTVQKHLELARKDMRFYLGDGKNFS